MKSEQFRHHGKPSPSVRDNQLLVADVVQYLSGLARLHKEDKTGNLELSKGLRHVAHALRPYADCPVLELADTIKKQTSSVVDSKTTSNRAESVFPPELQSTLESIGQDDIARILGDENCSKRNIVELGARRFGISRSRLERLRKKDARATVRAALDHEKSLDVITVEARRGGKARSL